MKKFFIFLVKIYQKTISPDHSLLGGFLFGKCCIFRPTCSDYLILSINRFGVIKGLIKGFLRILRCNPFNFPHFDPPY